MSTALPSPSHIPSNDLELETRITPHLDSFPSTAMGQFGLDKQMQPISQLLPLKGCIILVPVFDLVDDVAAIRQVVDEISSRKTKVFALNIKPDFYGEMFKTALMWAKQIGRAHGTLLVNHELSVLLGVDARYDKMRNGIIIIHDGKIVWSRVVDARRPNTPLQIQGFKEALDRLNY